MKLTPSLFTLAAFLCLGTVGHALQRPANGGFTIDFPILFSELDGSAFDSTCGGDGLVVIDSDLVVEGAGRIEVDIPVADLVVHGTLTMRDYAAIVEEDVWFLPFGGPVIRIETDGAFEMHDYSKIRSRGDVGGGAIEIIVTGDFVMNGFAQIDSTASSGYVGGIVVVVASGRIAMDSIFNIISAQGEYGGIVALFSTGSVADDAISIRGRVRAHGTGSRGVGGEIAVGASNGGLFIPGTKKLFATGQAADGFIGLAYVTVIGPTNPPNVKPAALVTQN